MEKVRYMISDAATLAGVESHVLRYWEDELDLNIPRNEMGHRYYTRENIQEFQRIRELKDQGYQLKAIRMILHNRIPEEKDPVLMPPAQIPGQQQVVQMPILPSPVQEPAVPEIPPERKEEETDAGERMAQFRELMSNIVGHAIAANNEELSIAIGQEVREQVLKEMNYLMREQEDAAEERYRRLDAAIRGDIRRKKGFFARAEKPKKDGKKKGKDSSNPAVQGA